MNWKRYFAAVGAFVALELSFVGLAMLWYFIFDDDIESLAGYPALLLLPFAVLAPPFVAGKAAKKVEYTRSSYRFAVLGGVIATAGVVGVFSQNQKDFMPGAPIALTYILLGYLLAGILFKKEQSAA